MLIAKRLASAKKDFLAATVRIPRSSEQLDEVRALMNSFIALHKDWYPEDALLIDAYFDARAFEEELESLPGKYVPPRGQLLLATFDGVATGYVALREIDSASCEMKRMFVYPRFPGKGVGRALGESIVQQGKSLSYRTMRLNTSIRQDEAKALYERLDFKKIPPYSELPEALREWLVFMELQL